MCTLPYDHIGALKISKENPVSTGLETESGRLAAHWNNALPYIQLRLYIYVYDTMSIYTHGASFCSICSRSSVWYTLATQLVCAVRLIHTIAPKSIERRAKQRRNKNKSMKNENWHITYIQTHTHTQHLHLNLHVLAYTFKTIDSEHSKCLDTENKLFVACCSNRWIGSQLVFIFLSFVLFLVERQISLMWCKIVGVQTMPAKIWATVMACETLAIPWKYNYVCLLDMKR